MIARILLYLSFLLAISSTALAQEQGFLRGNIQDVEFGGPLMGATIVLENQPTVGTTSDFDGNFSLPLDPGTYTIKVSFISYATVVISDVVINPGEVTTVNAEMRTSAQQLKAVEVSAKASRDSEAGMLLEMKNATNVVDGISSQSFRKIGDSDLSGAIKRVTGVTVQAGKYVYVRGLGDRYTKTTLNEMNIPGLDPDNNSVQIDIFPTAVLENVKVYKSFSPDLYGDFAGGLVDVITKRFPDEQQSQISVGVTYFPNMHFNNDFILYKGGALDWTGYDDGTRKIPVDENLDIPRTLEPLGDPRLEGYTRAFEPTMAAEKMDALPNGSFGFSTGNQINTESGKTWGYNAVFNYRNERAYYDNFENNVFLKDQEQDVNTLFRDESRKGVLGKQTVSWSGMLGGALKVGNHSFSTIILHSQSGESSALFRRNENFNQTGATLDETVLTYTQRSLSSNILIGQHNLNGWQLEWRNAFTYSRVYDPDFRSTAISLSNGSPTLNRGDGAGIDRFWRDLNEYNESFKVDVTKPVGTLAKVRFGGVGTWKWRTFETYDYQFTRTNASDIENDPDWFFQPENIWTPDDTRGTFVASSFIPSNQFDARQNVYGAYVMTEHPVRGSFKFIYGLRLEQANMFYTGENQAGDELDDEETLNETSFLPSLSVVWSLNEKMNLRGSANRTLARPTFREKSNAEIADPLTGRTFIGNLDLEQTDIWNFDLRYEYFLAPREVLSVAAFFKQFDGHIEMTPFPTDPDNIRPRNSGESFVYGVEFEVRKGLGNITSIPFLQRFFFGGNVSLIQSEVDLKSVIVDDDGSNEFDLREANARDGETIDDTRQMAGQSPYAVNANISYEIPESKTSLSLAYNVKGEQLAIVGSGRVPDIYLVPFHSLNFNAYRHFGKELNHRVTFGVQNLLDDDLTQVYKSYEADDEIFSTFNPGLGISLKYTYTF